MNKEAYRGFGQTNSKQMLTTVYREGKHIGRFVCFVKLLHSTASIASSLQRRRTVERMTPNRLLNGHYREAALSDDYLDSMVREHAPHLSRVSSASTGTFRSSSYMSLGEWNQRINASNMQQVYGKERFGLNESELASLRSFTVTTRSLQDKCCICIEGITQGDEAILLECSHGYHKKCICKWLKKQNSCPLCKQKVQ